jgi:hypothetical protein
MKTTSNLLIAGAALAATVGLGAYAFAQHGPGFGPGRMGMGHGMGPGMMMGKGPSMMMMGNGPIMGQFGEPAARLASLKLELDIKPDQEAAWDAYSKVVTETAAAQRTRAQGVSPDAVRKMEPKEREAFITGMQQERRKHFETVKAAAESLLAKLDDAQKAKARDTLPGLAALGHGPGMQRGMMGPGKGMGPPWMR